MKKSRLQISRERALASRKLPKFSLSMENDEEQLLSVIYAPNRTGFPDCTLATVVSNRPEVQEYVQQLMYKGDNHSYSDPDSSLAAMIPRNVQYGDELLPYLNSYLDYFNSFKKKEKDVEN